MNAELLQGAYSLDLVVRPGETFRGRFKWVEEDGKTPVSITGATPEIALRVNRQDAEPFKIFDLTDGVSLDPANGTALLVIRPNQSTLFVSQYVFDYKLTLGNGDAYFLAGGVVDAYPTQDPARVEFRTGMTALIRARGPVEIPVAAGSTGPFPSLDLRAPSGAFFRIYAEAPGALQRGTGTGLNAVDYIELAKPGGGALRMSMDNSGGFALRTAVSVSAATLTHVDFSFSGGTLRITANDSNTYDRTLL